MSGKCVPLCLHVLGFGLFQNWDVGVGIFPVDQEILVGGVGLGGVTLQFIRAGKAQRRQAVEH